MPSLCDLSPLPPPRLQVEGLTKRFGACVVLAGVDLAVGPAEVVVLAGSNGSGKTTLLRCVAGLARPSSGSILLDGMAASRRPTSRRRLGYLPQAPGLPAWSTGAELLRFFGRLRGAPGTAIPVPDGFLPPLDRPIGELSGGQRQRIALVAALLGEPNLLLLDEPAANLDEEGREALVTLLRDARDQGVSVLVAAPSPGEIGAVAARAVRIEDGRLVDGHRSTHDCSTRKVAG